MRKWNTNVLTVSDDDTVRVNARILKEVIERLEIIENELEELKNRETYRSHGVWINEDNPEVKWDFEKRRFVRIKENGNEQTT